MNSPSSLYQMWQCAVTVSPIALALASHCCCYVIVKAQKIKYNQNYIIYNKYVWILNEATELPFRVWRFHCSYEKLLGKDTHFFLKMFLYWSYNVLTRIGCFLFHPLYDFMFRCRVSPRMGKWLLYQCQFKMA